jgi:2,3-dihydroxyphenylpropionate 1,2-dioxygenase
MAQDTNHVQGRRFRDGFAQVAKAVARFQPTLVVYFGPDHMRALGGIAPCFTVVESATGYGDWGTPQEDYRVPHERAVALGQYLAASGIDIALAPHLRLDHGFGQSTAEPVRIAVSGPPHPHRHQLRRPPPADGGSHRGARPGCR